MMLVYLLATIITTTWLTKMVTTQTLILKRTPLDIPILLFLLSQIISTIFSIDPHTSLWGYYSRSNGGLFSIASYILLYYALVSNFSKDQVINFLKAAVLGGVLVSLYAIPEHFGLSPSCMILVQEFNASCWVQDVQARVFATLGQPNWLAAYLAMLIFPTIYFLLTAKNKILLITYFLSLIALYMAFTFTFSRGATLGLIAGGLVFIVGLIIVTLRQAQGIFGERSRTITLISIIISFVLINLIYGSALTRFKLFNEAPKTVTPQQQAAEKRQEAMQLEPGGGTESGQIRLIVWEGALEIFKHYPYFGSGVETFAYSYYNHRPQKHNLVSEWDFLYNKAHNEYLNYLATTGLFGFISYMSMILIFIIWCIRYYVLSIMGKQNQKTLNTYYLILIPSLLAAYISYLVQNIFGFSVVIIALFFFLFPGIAFVATDSVKEIRLKDFEKLPVISNILFVRSKLISNSIISYLISISLLVTIVVFIVLRVNLFIPIIILIIQLSLIPSNLFHKILSRKKALYTSLILQGIFIIYILILHWSADVFYKQGSDLADGGSPVAGYKLLRGATRLNPSEPLYRADLGFAAAGYSVIALEQKEATIASQYKDESIRQTNKALELSPRNTSIQRTVFQTYYQLSLVYPEFEDKTIQAIDTAIASAPTDAKLYYNKALVLSQFDKKEEAIKAHQKALELKPNYREARFNLAVVLFEIGKKDQAKKEMENILKQIPNDPDVLQKLKEWEEKEDSDN